MHNENGDKRFGYHNPLDNKLVAEPLENDVNKVLDLVGVSFQDFTDIYNFRGSGNKHVPDHVTEKYLMEDKFWDCFGVTPHSRGYVINRFKAEREINARKTNFPDLIPVLVITSPIWGEGVKEWLENEGWVIIELPYDYSFFDLYVGLYGLFAYSDTDNVISNLVDNCNNGTDKLVNNCVVGDKYVVYLTKPKIFATEFLPRQQIFGGTVGVG